MRNVQVHGASAESAVAGQRTAVNLANVAVEDLARGMVLTNAEEFLPTRSVDVKLEFLRGLRRQGPGAGALPCAHGGDGGERGTVSGFPTDEARHKLQDAGGSALCAPSVGEARVVVAGRPVYCAAVFSAGDDWGRRGAGCGAADADLAREHMEFLHSHENAASGAGVLEASCARVERRGCTAEWRRDAETGWTREIVAGVTKELVTAKRVVQFGVYFPGEACDRGIDRSVVGGGDEAVSR